MKKLLFLGGAGFIGSNIIRRLQHGEYDIHVCEPVGANTHRLKGLEVQIHYALISDIEDVSKVIQDNGIDMVVHLVSTLIPGSTYEDYKDASYSTMCCQPSTPSASLQSIRICTRCSMTVMSACSSSRR